MNKLWKVTCYNKNFEVVLTAYAETEKAAYDIGELFMNASSDECGFKVEAPEEWVFVEKGKGVAGEYRKSGWTVFNNGAKWKIENPRGYIYSIEFGSVPSAQRFTERLIRLYDADKK